MGGDLGGKGDGPQKNLRWGTAHAYVPTIFREIFLYIITNIQIVPITRPIVTAFQVKCTFHWSMKWQMT